MLPLAVDGFGNLMGLWNSTGWFRGLTGLGVGLSLPWLLAPLAQNIGTRQKPSLKNLRQLFWPALAGGIAVMWLDYGSGPILFRALAAVAAAGWFFFLGHFLLALVRAYRKSIANRSMQIFSPAK
jgi:hypothetical protein